MNQNHDQSGEPLEEIPSISKERRNEIFPTGSRPGLLYGHAEFRSLEFVVEGNHLLFNNSLYEQVYGVAMGSPSGTTFCQYFSFLLWNYLAQQPYFRIWISFLPTLCWRLFLPFLNYLKSEHANIKFTHETKDNNTLPLWS